MADLDKTRSDPKAQLWDEIDDVHAGMPGVEGSAQHMQPMAPQIDRNANTIWFFSKKQNDLVRSVGRGKKARFCVVGKDHDYHACLSGMLSQSSDRKKIDEFWNPVAAAWFDGGKEDPDLALLQLKLTDAAVWASTSNPVQFGWEIAKANLSQGEPDVGVQAHIDLS